eukprot:TRINITY_DN65480_c0_g1_i1.p3 TRINITY_DN65480_c0_g1~~TRINITY_DN65480_c0_g1_i1.p3  ORF type:complete len:140 (+),score=11.76 TRINITY_DN65480_c0_g1_i1:43-420(+)
MDNFYYNAPISCKIATPNKKQTQTALVYLNSTDNAQNIAEKLNYYFKIYKYASIIESMLPISVQNKKVKKKFNGYKDNINEKKVALASESPGLIYFHNKQNTKQFITPKTTLTERNVSKLQIQLL